MGYLYSNLGVLNDGDIVEVDLDSQANVILLDSGNYHAYKQGWDFNYYGGWAQYSPYDIAVPYSGLWHLVIDLGGTEGYIRYSINVISERQGQITPQQRAQAEREIRDKEAALEEFRSMHPRDKIRIKEMENEIAGLKRFLKYWR